MEFDIIVLTELKHNGMKNQDIYKTAHSKHKLKMTDSISNEISSGSNYK